MRDERTEPGDEKQTITSDHVQVLKYSVEVYKQATMLPPAVRDCRLNGSMWLMILHRSLDVKI